jgi:hypothetical protein
VFGSQVPETLIRLVTMFVVLATAASAIIALSSRLLRKRAKDLERMLDELLAGSPVSAADLMKAKKAVQAGTRTSATSSSISRCRTDKIGSSTPADSVREERAWTSNSPRNASSCLPTASESGIGDVSGVSRESGEHRDSDRGPLCRARLKTC